MYFVSLCFNFSCKTLIQNSFVQHTIDLVELYLTYITCDVKIKFA